jgi:hypothetical protein
MNSERIRRHDFDLDPLRRADFEINVRLDCPPLRRRAPHRVLLVRRSMRPSLDPYFHPNHNPNPKIP